MTQRTIRSLVAIPIGAAIMGFGLNEFNIANNLAEGGLTGVSLLLKLALDIDPGLSVIVLNVPLFLLGWRMLGRFSLVWTVYGTGCLALALWAFGSFRLPLGDPLLASLYAGVCVGVGLGIVFRFGGTTGGVDIIARILNKHFGWSMGRIMFAADMLVIAGSLVYLTVPQVMYTLVAVFVGARVIDFVQEAAYAARAVLAVTERAPELARRVTEEMGRGATILTGRGGFTGKAREVLYIVVSRHEIMHLKRVIRAVDPFAFVSVTDVHEVLGEGFTYDDKNAAGASG
jgi:uncharacterized membrane-anchored protein YitT (DUF2179 family)